MPPSPEATAIAKYGDTPVGYYNGIPSIQVPIYTINSRDISIPISVSYHAGGIRVEEEASQVGLGWSLSAGGAITRSVRGLDDFLDAGSKEGYLDSSFDVDQSPVDIVELVDIANGEIDTQPDIFNFSFLGVSGKFILERRATTNDPIKVKLLSFINIDVSYDTTNHSWEVRDSKGYKYIFEAKEYSNSGSTSISNPSIHPDPITVDPTQPDMITAWYLTKVISPKKEEVLISYDLNPDGSSSYRSRSVVSITESRKYLIEYEGDGLNAESATCGNSFQFFATQQFNHHAYVDKITFNHGELIFDYSDRTDIRAISGYSPPQKLDKIELKSGGSVLRQWDFTYTYFNSGQSPAFEAQRLKLEKIQESSGSTEKGPFEFEYSTVNLPFKNSYSRDHWGFFNGAANGSAGPSGNPTLIPRIETVYDGTGQRVTLDTPLGGADREVDASKIVAGSLTGITWPTGGKSAYIFEPHEVSFEDLETIVPLENFNQSFDGQSPHVFRLTDVTEITLNAELKCNTLDCYQQSGTECSDMDAGQLSTAYIEIIDLSTGLTVGATHQYSDYLCKQFPGQGYCTNGIQSNNCGISRQSVFSLEAGEYLIRAYDLFGRSANGSISYVMQQNISTAIAVQKTYLVGGLRISEMWNEDGLGQVTMKKKFIYEEDGKSTGLLMNEPKYGNYMTTVYPGTAGTWNSCGNAELKSSSNKPLASSAQGSAVGYSTVRVINGADYEGGYSLFEYNNKQNLDLEFYSLGALEVPNAPQRAFYASNGLLEKEQHFDKNDRIVSENITSYGSEQDSVKILNTYVAGYMGSATTGTSFVVLWYNYYEPIEWFYPSTKTSRQYSSQHDGTYVETVESFTYDHSVGHYQLIESTLTDSEGLQRKSKHYYPLDISGTPGEMKNSSNSNYQNMNGIWVKKEDYVDGQLTTISERDYAYDAGADMILLQNEDISQTGDMADLTTRAEFQQYDNGNLVQFTRPSKSGEDGLVTSILWGYDDAYPVAKIENATYSEVTTALGAGTTTVEGTNNSAIRTVLLGLQTSLPDALITIYLYDPVVGVVETIGPNGIATKYEYDELQRLEVVEDHLGNKRSQYSYSYHSN